MYLRELQAAIDEYLAPTNLGTMDPMTMYMIPANDQANRTHPGVGKVILKPTALHPDGYVIYDHTGDMYPEIWWTEDARAVQAALKEVLAAEGKPDAFPALFMAAHYFSDTHGVQPASKALGAKSCADCHGSEAGIPGAHRIGDRKISFLPWAPPWFNESNRLLKFNTETNAMEGTGAAGDDGNGAFFIVDGEVDYINPTGGNGLAFLGAEEHDILELSHHHAQHLFYQTHGEELLGSAIYGLLYNLMSEEENQRLYVPQVALYQPQYKGLSADYIPAELRPEVSAFGYSPVEQEIKIKDGNGNISTATVKPLIYDLLVDALPHPEEQYMGILAMLEPAKGSTIGSKFFNPRIVFQPAGSSFFSPWIVINDEDLPKTERRATIVRYLNYGMHKWILRAGPGRYAVVHPDDMMTNSADVVPAPVDACGVENGDGSTCADCTGTPNGNAIVDACGVCEGDNSTCTDVCGVVNGDNSTCTDACGVVNGDDSTCTDACGVVNGDDSTCTDACGVVNGDGSTCADACGVANGDNSTCTDACGVINGDNSTCTDECGVVNGDGSTCIDYCGVYGECTVVLTVVGNDYTYLQSGTAKTLYYADAVRYCNELDYAGSTGWNMPDRLQMEALYGAGPAPFVNPDFKVASKEYWTSEDVSMTHRNEEDKNPGDDKVTVNFKTGRNSTANSSGTQQDKHRVICVR
jgi:hypothetical protein